jgi:NAD(P)-dependent dehydrogenase (short-subunit alcohol dehydrogenase family)
MTTKTALITGASTGFGRAVARALAAEGWTLTLTARGASALAAVADELGAQGIPGDISDPQHRSTLPAVDLLINNASHLGPSPQPGLVDYPLDELRRVYEVNVFGPLALIQRLRPPTVVNVSSDAAVEAYEGWGGYGSSKAALDQLSAILAVERPDARVYAFDPGDMRTDLHQAAFPGDDISDRPEPETVVPALLRLLDKRPLSGRYRRDEL